MVSGFFFLFVCLDMRKCKNWAHKIFWRYLSKGLFCSFFPEHRVPLSCSPYWAPFRVSWRSEPAAAHELFLIVDGRCQICSWHSTYFALWNPSQGGRSYLEKTFLIVLEEGQEGKWNTIPLKAELEKWAIVTILLDFPVPGRSFSPPEGRSPKEQQKHALVELKMTRDPSLSSKCVIYLSNPWV